MQYKPWWVILTIILSLLLSACSSVQYFIAESSPSDLPNTPEELGSNGLQPTTDFLPTAEVALENEQISTLWISSDVPTNFVEQLELPKNLEVTTEEKTADYILKLDKENIVSEWVYALGAAFPTVLDDIATDDLLSLWKGEVASETVNKISSLLIDSNTLTVFASLWGLPGSMVKIIPTEQILNAAWAERTALALFPFTDLKPEWKVISVDSNSPLSKNFNLETYPLRVPISLFTTVPDKEGSSFDFSTSIPTTNRDPNKLTTVALSGVTGMVRATAGYMEAFGVTYPAEDIGPLLRDADILHINNEIPFAIDCPFPDPSTEASLIFCSRDKYIELLEYIGTDVIELTGDHFQDWGDEAVLHTLDLYNQRDWLIYGGGENLEKARQPLLLEHNGNRLAFLGCNGKEAGYALASETRPGAYHCDMDWMESEVRRLVSENYLVIVTFQHLEYYDSVISPLLQEDFQRVAEAGALIVSGSQAHQPHGFEFYENALIHYGLGNLFFDQYNWCIPCRSAFIDQHIFYDGRYLGVELITIQFENNARSRLTTQEEREALLELIFSSSAW